MIFKKTFRSLGSNDWTPDKMTTFSNWEAFGNFYTRHVLLSAVRNLTDGEIRMQGTVRMNLVGSWTKPGVRDVINCADNLSRGAW